MLFWFSPYEDVDAFWLGRDRGEGKLLKEHGPPKGLLNLALLALLAGTGFSCKDATGPEVIDPPSAVTVTLVSSTSARITWTASPQADKVRSYNVFRNGQKIGEVSATTYSDDGLAELANYKYAVSANGISGVVSALSADSPSASITVPDATPPRVVSISPASGATGVSLSATIAATFSESVDPATLSASTFVVKNGGATISGTVAYTAATRVAEFTPSSALPNAAQITVTIGPAVKDIAGNAMTTAFTSTFTLADQVPPTVVGVTPASGSASQPVNTVPTVAFSRAMNSATLNNSTITLTPGGGSAVATTVTYNASTNVATVTPASALAFSTQYTLTVTTGVAGANGIALAVPFTSTFSTAGAPDTTRPTIVSVAPVTGATDVAVGTVVTVTFSEAMIASSVNSSTLQVTAQGGGAVAGSVFYDAANLRATFTPSASLVNSTVYTVTATTAATDLSGNGLVAFSSSFTTAAPADVTPPGVVSINPINGTSSVPTSITPTVTFNRAMSVASLTSSTITIAANGGSPIATTVSYNPGTNTATITPSGPLAFSTSYTLTVTTGVLGSNGVALPASVTAGFATAAAPDATRPTVVSVTPANGATGVAVNSAVVITFSEPLNPSTITSSSVQVAALGIGPVSGTISYDAPNLRVIFTPSSLQNSTTYAVSLTSAITDLAGNGLVDFSSSFATVAPTPPPDTTRPTVTSISPSNGAINVAINTSIVVNFSEPMNPSSVNGSTLVVTGPGGAFVAGSVSYDAPNLRAIFIPSSLQNSTTYSVSLTTGMTDLAGNSLVAFSASFTTVPPADTTRPTVISTSPGNGATDVAINSSVVVNFSEPMNASTVNSSTLLVADCTNPRAGSVTYDAANSRAIFTPSTPLQNSTNYFITASTGMTDVAGNTLVGFSSSFVTVAGSSGSIDLSGQPAWSGTTCSNVSGIHIHIVFAQSGQTLTLGTCPRGDCIMAPLNQAASNIVGPNTPGEVWATINSLTGTLNGSQLTFTLTTDNGRSFTFTGSAASSTSIAGTLSGATQPAVGLSMAR